MAKAKKGDTVRVHYTGTLNNGTVFDSSADREPLEFTLGNNQVIPGFEKGIEGMEENEKKNITIPVEDAYGERKDELIVKFPKSNLPADIDPQIGQQLQMKNQNGQSFVVVVSDMDDNSVSLDANHPLSGEELNFEIELVEVV